MPKSDAGVVLKEVSHILDDLNSSYPATQEFLRAKGVENVSDLTHDQREELTEFLKEKFKARVLELNLN